MLHDHHHCRSIAVRILTEPFAYANFTHYHKKGATALTIKLRRGHRDDPDDFAGTNNATFDNITVAFDCVGPDPADAGTIRYSIDSSNVFLSYFLQPQNCMYDKKFN